MRENTYLQHPPSVFPTMVPSSDPIPVPDEHVTPPMSDEEDDQPTQPAAFSRTRVQSAGYRMTSFRLAFERQAKHEEIDDEVNATLAQKGAFQMSSQNLNYAFF